MATIFTNLFKRIIKINVEGTINAQGETGTDFVVICPVGEKGFGHRFETGGDMAVELRKRRCCHGGWLTRSRAMDQALIGS